jgi:hypothetical protein
VEELTAFTFKEVHFVGRKLNGKTSSNNVVSDVMTTIIVIKINLFMIIL